MTSQRRRFAESRSSRSGRPPAGFRPALETLEDRTLLSTIYAVTPGNVLIRFDSATPGSVTTIGAISGLGANETVRGIDFRPRTAQLYASTVTTGAANNSVIFTYRINPLNAQATFVGQTAAPLAGAGDVPTGYDFNPTVDRIRYVNTNDENARLNPNNGGLASNDTDLTPAATTTIIAEAYDRNWNRQRIPAPPAAPTNSPIATTLYAIDRNDSQLSIQGGLNGVPSPDAGILTDLAPLGFNLNQANDGGFDINARGEAFAALTDAADNLTRLYRINLVTGITINPAATSIGLIGNGTTEVRSIAIVPEGIIVAGTDAGGPPRVRVFDLTGVPQFGFRPYAIGFRGGVRVAAGDVTGDGVSDIITAPGPGIPGRIRVANGRTGALASFFPFGQNYNRGIFVASADVDADGWDDFITGTDAGAIGRVRVFSGRTGGLIAAFLPYGSSFKGGVRLAAVDFDLDGTAEIVTARGTGRGHVRIFTGAGAAWTPVAVVGVAPSQQQNSFFAYGPGVTGGAFVAAGDVHGDGYADIITGPGRPAAPRVNVFSGAPGSLGTSFLAYPASFGGGVRVGFAEVNRDGLREVLTAGGPGAAQPLRFVNAFGQSQKDAVFAFGNFTGGVFVAGQVRS